MSKILLIDDYKTSRELLTNLLQKKGFLVDPAPDGETGLTLAQKSSYDLVLIDLILPRISAYTLIEQLLGFNPPVSIQKLVILYTVGSDDLLQPIKELGVVNFVLKSTTNQEAIISQIEKLCPITPTVA